MRIKWLKNNNKNKYKSFKQLQRNSIKHNKIKMINNLMKGMVLIY